MPAIVLNGDLAGGAIIATETSVLVNGRRVALVGDLVTPHGTHVGAYMIQGSSTVFINGRAVVRDGDLASCGHQAIATSTHTIVG